MLHIIKTIAILILVFLSFSSNSSQTSSELTKRFKATLNDHGTLTVDNQYMTHYTVRVEGENGTSDRVFIDRNTQKVDFSLDTELKVESDGFYVRLNKIAPRFNSVQSTLELSGTLTENQGTWKNSTLHVNGGNLYDLFLNEETDNPDDVILALLNTLTLMEVTASTASKAVLKGNAKAKFDKVKVFFNKFKNIKDYINDFSTYYTLIKVMFDEVTKVAISLGGVDEHTGIPLNKDVAVYYNKLKSTLDLIDKVNASIQSVGTIVIDTEAEKVIKETIKNDYESKLSVGASKSMDEINKAWAEASAKAFESINADEDAKRNAVSDYLIQPLTRVAEAYNNVLILEYEKAEKAKNEAEKERIKRKKLILSSGKGFLQLALFVSNSRPLLEVIKYEPKKAPEIILPMLWEMSEALAKVIVNSDTINNYKENFFNNFISIIGTNGQDIKYAAENQVYYKAFSFGKEAANVFLFYVSDFVLAPNKINSSIIEGKLNQLGQMKYTLQVESYSGGDTPSFEFDENSPRDVHIYAKEGSIFRVYANLYRPKLFNPQYSPWLLQSNYPPNTAYDVLLSIGDSAKRNIMCVKNVLGIEVYAYHTFFNSDALTFSAGQCDAGELGFDGEWFGWETYRPSTLLERYDDSQNIMPDTLKLNNDDVNIFKAFNATTAASTPIIFSVSGVDMPNIHKVIHTHIIDEDNQLELLANSDSEDAANFTFNAQMPAITEAGDSILSYTWDFGDGSDLINSNENATSYTYSESGKYEVTVTIITSFGYSFTQTYTVEVVVPPKQLPYPESFTLTNSSEKITLSWNAVEGADGYQIYMSDNADINSMQPSTYITSQTVQALENSLIWENLLNNETYYFAIETIYGLDGASELSPVIVGQPQSDTPNVERGLIANYEMNGDGSDSSGNNHHAIRLDALADEDRHGIDDNALYFDGYMVMEAGNLPIEANAITLSIWAKLDSEQITAGGGITPFFNKHQSIHLVVENERLQFSIGSGIEPKVTVDSLPTANVWSHIVATYDGTNLKLYLDGSLVGEKEYTEGILISNYPLFIASDEVGNYQYLAGSVDDARIYNRALSSAEITELYEFDKPASPIELEEGLVAYYPFDDNANDYSGNGHNGVKNGTITYASGAVGKAINFDGNYQNYIRVPHHDDLNIKGDYTFSYWVNRATDSGPQFMISKGRDCNNSYYSAYGGQLFDVTQGNTWCDGAGAFGTININEWHFVTVIINNSESSIQYYLNGQLESEVPISPYSTTNNYDLVFGRHDTYNNGSVSYAYPYTGKLDEVRIYNRALTNVEITELYNLSSDEEPNEPSETLVFNSIEKNDWFASRARSRNSENWSAVNVTDNYVMLNQDQTDNGPSLLSIGITPVDGKRLKISRTLELHSHISRSYLGGNEFFVGGINVYSSGNSGKLSSDNSLLENMCQVRYYDYEYQGDWDTFFLNDRDDLDARIPSIWDSTFEEVFTYDPQTGFATYQVRSNTVTAYCEPLNQDYIRINMHTYGWWTGHYTKIFDFDVRWVDSLPPN